MAHVIDYVEFAVDDPDEAKAFYGRTLQSWEDRFDACLVAIGFDTITLAVGRAPSDLQSATRIAAEHLAFCSDNIFQGPESVGAYARLLVDNHRWDFWWD